MTCVLNVQSLELLVLPLGSIDGVVENVKVLRTVCQGQFNLHAVVTVIGEDAVLRYIFYLRPPYLALPALDKLGCASANRASSFAFGLHKFSVYRHYHKKISRFTRQR